MMVTCASLFAMVVPRLLHPLLFADTLNLPSTSPRAANAIEAVPATNRMKSGRRAMKRATRLRLRRLVAAMWMSTSRTRSVTNYLYSEES